MRVDFRAVRGTIGIIGLGWATLLVVRPAAAQTRFLGPSQPLDFERYATPHQCLAAVERIANDVWWDQRRDTLPYDPAEPLPATAREAARRCGVTRFTLEKVGARDIWALHGLALAAGDEALADAIVRHVLAGVDPGDAAARAGVLRRAFEAYLAARPLRRAAMMDILTRMDSLGRGARRERADSYHGLVRYAQDVADTALERAATLKWLSLIPDSLREQPIIRGVRLERMGKLEFLDLIGRLSADLWISRHLALSRRIFGPGFVPRVGRQVSPLHGDFWFNRSTADEVPPRSNRWSLIVRISAGCGDDCFEAHAVLKRLHRRFGAGLDITLVTQTRGHFRRRPPPAAAEEAEWIRAYFLDYLGLPGALSVTVTPFVRRPDPDRRRVNQEIANDGNLFTGRTTSLLTVDQIFGAPPSATLVDPRGRIMYDAPLAADRERELALIIGAFVRHPG